MRRKFLSVRWWLAVALTLHVSVANANDTSNNSTQLPSIANPERYSSGNDQTKMLREAVKQYRDNKHIRGMEQCHMDYFDILDNDNIIASNYTKWWHEQRLIEIKKDPVAYEIHGEQEFFARKMMDMPNSQCSILQGGCQYIPATCNIVMDHITRVEPELSLEEALDKSRKILFMFAKTNEYYAAHGSIRNLLTAVEAASKAAAARIVAEHTRHSTGRSEAACAGIKAGVEISVDVIAVALSATGGTVFFKGVEGASKAVLDTVVPQVMAFTVRTGDKIAVAGGKAAEELLKSHLNGDRDGVGDLHMQQATGTGICSMVDGNLKKEDFERFGQMSTHMTEVFREIRTGMEGMLTTVMRNNDTSAEVSLLAMALSDVNYQETMKSLKMGTAKFEEIVARKLMEKYISYAAASSQCLVTCTIADNRVEQQKYCTKKWWNWKSRACPEDAGKQKNVACQVGCWTKRHLDNRWQEMTGQEYLPKDVHMNTSEVVLYSYQNYLKHGASGVPAGEIVGDFKSLNAVMTGNETVIDVPVCISEYGDIHNFDHDLMSGGAFEHWRNLNQNFPCTCGDMHSSDTPEVMRRLGYGPGTPEWNARKQFETIENLCLWNLQWDSPYRHFMAYCQLGIRHPVRPLDGKDVRMDHGTNEYCDAIRKEVDGMSERDAAKQFCYYSPYGQQVQRDERDKAQGILGFYAKGHKLSCHDWKGLIWSSLEPDMPTTWIDDFNDIKVTEGKVGPTLDLKKFLLDNPEFNFRDPINMTSLVNMKGYIRSNDSPIRIDPATPPVTPPEVQNPSGSTSPSLPQTIIPEASSTMSDKISALVETKSSSSFGTVTPEVSQTMSDDMSKAIETASPNIQNSAVEVSSHTMPKETKAEQTHTPNKIEEALAYVHEKEDSQRQQLAEQQYKPGMLGGTL